MAANEVETKRVFVNNVDSYTGGIISKVCIDIPNLTDLVSDLINRFFCISI